MAVCNIDTIKTQACSNGFACVSEMEFRLLLLQLACNLSAGGGGGGGSCLVCETFDPNTPSTCSCGFWTNTTTGGVWYWSSNPPWNPGVPEWTVLIVGV